MRLERFPTPATFDDAAEAWLAGAEQENNLLLSALRSTRRHDSQARGWLVTHEDTTRLALFQIPPHYLLLSRGTARAAAYAAEVLEADLPGVFGPAAVADAFARQWSQRTGRAPALNGSMTFYMLDRVEPFARPGGCLRRAAYEEFDRLMPLAIAAARDMNLPAPEQVLTEVENGVRRAIAEGRQFVWAEASTIRSMASYVEALPGAGARIRGVYTPPEFRGQGYGTAVTGTLAESLLEEGQAWVSLFADDANPTSTGIYRRLGFRPGSVFHSLRFGLF